MYIHIHIFIVSYFMRIAIFFCPHRNILFDSSIRSENNYIRYIVPEMIIYFVVQRIDKPRLLLYNLC